MKVISTKVTNPEWEALLDICNENGMTIAEYLRELLHGDSDATRNVANQEEKPAQSIRGIRKDSSRNGQSRQITDELSELLKRYRK